jgi:hypothetical protein
VDTVGDPDAAADDTASADVEIITDADDLKLHDAEEIQEAPVN